MAKQPVEKVLVDSQEAIVELKDLVEEVSPALPPMVTKQLVGWDGTVIDSYEAPTTPSDQYHGLPDAVAERLRASHGLPSQL